MGTANTDRSQCADSSSRWQCRSPRWGNLSNADLRGRSHCYQPSANSGQPQRHRLTSSIDAESHFNHENKAGFTTTWRLSKRRSVLEETMETSPAPGVPVLGPLEKGVLTKPSRKIQVDSSPPQPSDWRRGDC